jgi:ATPase subunit of ABC transporter with duplicated ATPase domains
VGDSRGGAQHACNLAKVLQMPAATGCQLDEPTNDLDVEHLRRALEEGAAAPPPGLRRW